MKNMNPEAYLNVSVDHLFEQHTITEIEQVHKKLQNEIEQKKMEIRRFVGERYRDLIQAADSIGEMKSTSVEIISHVNTIASSCKALNDQQLIGFRNEVSAEVKEERLQKAKFFGVVLQIKILSKIPELIWKLVDEEDFFVATQLFVFSRHIFTGLKVSTNADLVNKFPVVEKLWDSLGPFYGIIREKCLKTLEREKLEANLAAKCLAGILLLENCDFERLVRVLVDARSKAFEKTLDDESYEKAREKILASLRVLNETVELLHSCFKEHLLFNELRNLSSDHSSPTLGYIFDLSDPKLQFLPEIVSKFKPQVSLADVDDIKLKTVLEEWLTYVKKAVSSKINAIVALITTIKTIQEVKRQTLKVPKPSLNVLQSLSLPENLDFYVNFYQHLVDLRLQQIIQDAWKLATNETLEETQKVLKESGKRQDTVKSWVWREEIEDNPRSLKSALEAPNDQKKLLMKACGFTPEIVDLCMKFDKKLAALFGDVKAYLTGESEANFRLRTDAMPDQIGAFLNECSRENINSIVSQVKALPLEEDPESLILLALLLQAIPQLCSHLRSCLSQSSLTSNFQDLATSNDLYHQTSLLLADESTSFWMRWLEVFCLQLDDYFKESRTDFNTMLKEFPSWELVTIQEKDEQDNAVDSTIRVPSKPSFPLQRFLHETCSDLNKVNPHTFPKVVSAALLVRIAKSIHKFYHEQSQIDFVRGNQNASLQYYFDLRFVSVLLVPKDNKDLLEAYQSLTQEFKNFIDPFDFDVFYPFVNENVKKSAHRTQYQIGCLTAVPESQGLSQGKQEKDPNVLALTSNTTTIMWFPLLPISDSSAAENAGGLSTVASTGKLAALIDGEKTTLTSSKSSTSLDKTLRTAQNYADNVKSGAAAFFGDWFKS